ncbi:MAG: hypothetical protein FJ298_14680 [Planctomycetes bacterium]|nr:hypothetical protein [Planctomycetota bacterium]
MTQNKHLLEALTGQGGRAPQGGAPSAGGPSIERASAGRGGLSLSGSRLQMLVLAQIVLTVVAFLLGRASVQPVEAGANSTSDASNAGGVFGLGANPNASGLTHADPSAAAVTGAPAPDAGGVGNGVLSVRPQPTPVSAAEQALRDPRNIYTLKVADYVYNESSVRLAQDAARYLTESAALPACLVQKGTRVYLLVGAAPRQVDLDELGRTVRQLKGPPPISKPTEFYDAYVEKIDKVFQRK